MKLALALLLMTPIPVEARCEVDGVPGLWDVTGTQCITAEVYEEVYGADDVSFDLSGVTFADYLETPAPTDPPRHPANIYYTADRPEPPPACPFPGPCWF